MANLKEIKNRISSVQSTRQITSAMQMVSASKLKKAQNAIIKMRPFSEKLHDLLSNLSKSLDLSQEVFSQERVVNKVLIVAISSNRGLCGGFNNNIVKKVKYLINNDFKNCHTSLITVGKKVNDSFKKSSVLTNLADILDDKSIDIKNEELYNNLNFNNVAILAENIMKAYSSQKVDKVVIVYNHFNNAASQVVVTEQFLPIATNKQDEVNNTQEYIFEPSQKEITTELIPKSLKIQLYKAILDSFASEHGARSTAMHKATDNATELERELKLTYNKARQAAITNEILEIVGGAEALNA